MYKAIFPPLVHPEDANPHAAYLARLVFFAGILAFVWSGGAVLQWLRSAGYAETSGIMRYGVVELSSSGVANASYDYEVNGMKYTSQNIAFGGRPFGGVPREGPVRVYYDPSRPGLAVLMRRPAEAVSIAFVFALLSPFLARFIWKTYV